MPKLFVVNLYAHEYYDPQDVLSRFHYVANTYNEAVKKGEEVWDTEVSQGYVVDVYPLVRVNGYRIELVKEK